MLDLRKFRGIALAVTAAAALSIAPAALASGGGVNSGGVNSGGVNGGGGGGGGKAAPAGTSCVNITGFASTDGYYSVWAAIWTNWSISSSCGGGVQLTWTMSYVNGNTGAVDFERSSVVVHGTQGGVVDEDWAAFSTPYTVRLSVSDSDGNVLADQSALVSTKPPKQGGGL